VTNRHVHPATLAPRADGDQSGDHHGAGELRDAGVLDEEESQTKKAGILRRFSTSPVCLPQMTGISGCSLRPLDAEARVWHVTR
jgi:hypothetical protein